LAGDAAIEEVKNAGQQNEKQRPFDGPIVAAGISASTICERTNPQKRIAGRERFGRK